VRHAGLRVSPKKKKKRKEKEKEKGAVCGYVHVTCAGLGVHDLM
jgi:hypothetical protein